MIIVKTLLIFCEHNTHPSECLWAESKGPQLRMLGSAAVLEHELVSGVSEHDEEYVNDALGIVLVSESTSCRAAHSTSAMASIARRASRNGAEASASVLQSLLSTYCRS